MTRFEDNLWRELEDTYGGELSQAEGPLSARPALRRPAIAGAGLGVVGAGAAAVLILTAAGSTPAFAVTPQRDGSVSVVIRRIDGIPGANRRLAELGIRARAVRVADGCQAVSPGALTQVAVATLVRRGGTAWVGRTPDTIRTQIRPAQIPSGRTLVIPALRTGARVRLVRGHAVRGAVPACLSPAVQVRTAVAGPIIQVVGCRDGVPAQAETGPATARGPFPAPRTGAVGSAGTGTATQTETTSRPAASTQTEPATGGGTATQTEAVPQPGTATNPGPTVTGPSTGLHAVPGSAGVKLPPPLVRACRYAAQAATR